MCGDSPVPRLEFMTEQLNADKVRGYVDAGGLRTYYEAEGTGEPLLVLHGGFCTVETFGGLTPTLAERHRVYSPERRGHGRTPDVDGPITYEIMARDTIAFMEAVHSGPAHLFGWSDGANVALITALYRPDLVRKLVLMGTAVNISGGTEFAQASIGHLTVDMLPPMLREAYEAVSPDGPEHFAVVVEKLAPAIAVTTTELSDLERITAPTLVIVADNDMVTIEHAAAMQRALPDSQLAVVPGTSHALPLEKPDLVLRLILDFIA